jgi:hypothetical protein
LSLETCRGGKINTLKKEKSASSWLKIHNCLRMHGQQNIKSSYLHGLVLNLSSIIVFLPLHGDHRDLA